MNELAIFKYQDAQVRTIADEKGKTWFVAKDVAEILGYSNSRKAVKDHCKHGRSIGSNESLPLDPQTILIPEGDVFRLVIKSKLPAAEKFEEWVMDEVIPSVRQTGKYEIAPTFQIPQTLPEALRLAATLADEVELQKGQLAIAAPKVEALDRIATRAEGTMNITNTAKNLQIRPKDLFDYLKMNQWIYRRFGNSDWIAYQDKIQRGLMEHKVVTVSRSDGSEIVTTQALITARGLASLAHKLNT